MYKHILVPLDGSEFAEKVLPHVEALAKQFGSQVTLVRATTPEVVIVTEMTSQMTGQPPQPAMDAKPIVEAEQQEAETYLKSVAEHLKGEGIDVQYQRQEGAPAEVITKLASRLGVDLIAMTTHGRGGLQRVVLGSDADAVVRHAPCPVLLVRAREAAG